MNDDKLRCAKCGSAHIHSGMRGWSWLTGIFGSGSVLITCLACGHRMKPGQAILNGAQTKSEDGMGILFGVLGWMSAIVVVLIIVAVLHR
ncbi:hypothetical protein SBC1_14360 [Caballeronia sp. SBC1]|uniref:hypothetical protein n=1 Tax=Caballeronia sp. SBC1 TaxID=2705548 RepID=UPI0013E10D29|nr:hypothetical protein [Caballeronia sp. SBC1]QIE23549.1 hypothetical protein SBC2_15750 [Caballeronia sp. SBC2]QIN61444.1 hypothetical protein SBC1_14360 [Caballeronia sp. SBC1]